MMFRSLLLLAGICAITYLEFSFYPGHTYLRGESQPLVAMMERLQAPGFLSRDLVAINPNLTYTIYDEVTLFLCRSTAHDIQWVLALQQLLFRFAGVLGTFLLCLSAGIRPLPALLTSAIISAGVVLPGLQLTLTDPEPVPFAFALAVTILAFGLLANSKPLLAGLSGGIAIVYQPVIAGAFWLFVIATFLFRRELRPILRPTFPALIVFTLLLANAAQLQSGRGESHPFSQTISLEWQQLQLFRTPQVWISTWTIPSLLFYAAAAALGGLALRLLWPMLNPMSRHLFCGLICIGVLSLPAAFLGTEVLRSALLCEAQLARALSLLLLASLILSVAAAVKIWSAKRLQACLWIAASVSSLIPLSAPLASNAEQSESESVRSMAQWAVQNTWGGSMFLFPDAGKSMAPGEFRGLATRAIYTDWTSGSLLDVYPAFGSEWYSRWVQTSAPQYSIARLKRHLELPVEYVVLRTTHRLVGIHPELTTADFLVYDSHVLQTTGHDL